MVTTISHFIDSIAIIIHKCFQVLVIYIRRYDLFILPELEILYASATLLLIIYNYLLDPELKHARNLEAHDDDHSYTA